MLKGYGTGLPHFCWLHRKQVSTWMARWMITCEKIAVMTVGAEAMEKMCALLLLKENDRINRHVWREGERVQAFNSQAFHLRWSYSGHKHRGYFHFPVFLQWPVFPHYKKPHKRKHHLKVLAVSTHWRPITLSAIKCWSERPMSAYHS